MERMIFEFNAPRADGRGYSKYGFDERGNLSIKSKTTGFWNRVNLSDLSLSTIEDIFSSISEEMLNKNG